jgi:hypothetical protein
MRSRCCLCVCVCARAQVCVCAQVCVSVSVYPPSSLLVHPQDSGLRMYCSPCVTVNQNTRCHIPVDSNVNKYNFEVKKYTCRGKGNS